MDDLTFSSDPGPPAPPPPPVATFTMILSPSCKQHTHTSKSQSRKQFAHGSKYCNLSNFCMKTDTVCEWPSVDM